MCIVHTECYHSSAHAKSVLGYMALSLGNDWGDSRRSSDETASVLLGEQQLA